MLLSTVMHRLSELELRSGEVQSRFAEDVERLTLLLRLVLPSWVVVCLRDSFGPLLLPEPNLLLRVVVEAALLGVAWGLRVRRLLLDLFWFLSRDSSAMASSG